jgi:hypothetical protein
LFAVKFIILPAKFSFQDTLTIPPSLFSQQKTSCCASFNWLFSTAVATAARSTERAHQSSVPPSKFASEFLVDAHLKRIFMQLQVLQPISDRFFPSGVRGAAVRIPAITSASNQQLTAIFAGLKHAENGQNSRACAPNPAPTSARAFKCKQGQPIFSLFCTACSRV